MSKYPYIYLWGNNPKRMELKGKRFKIIKRGKMNSCLAEFEDGNREIISRNAIRKNGNSDINTIT